MEGVLKKIENKITLLSLEEDSPLELDDIKFIEIDITRWGEKIKELKELQVEGREKQIEENVPIEEIKAWNNEINKQIEGFQKHRQILKKRMEEIQKQLQLQKQEMEENELRRKNQRQLEELEVLKIKAELQSKIQPTEIKSKDEKPKVRLPKLIIASFNGTYEDWQRFWSQFEVEIDQMDIPQITKFSYLKEMVKPKVRLMIDGLPFNSEGYERAKNILKDRFGKTSKIVNVYVQKIIELPTIYGANPKKINDFYESLSNSVQVLDTMGHLKEVNGLVRSTMEKIPDVTPNLVILDNNWENWKFGELVNALKLWTERNPVKIDIKRSYIKKEEKSFTAKDEKSHHKCVYCNSEHSSTCCDKVIGINERREILRSKHLCFNCTKTGHRVIDCKSRSCYSCKGRHHTSICDKVKNSPKDPMLSVISDSVVYPVVTVLVNGVKVRALLDTGAGSCYASSNLIKHLNIKPVRNEARQIEMLMHTATKKMSIYNIDITNVKGDFKINTDVSKVDKDVLLKISNPNYKQLIASYRHLSGVKIEDQATDQELPVHLILGASLYARIKTTEPQRIGNDGNPTAERTKLGWMIMSPGAEIDSKMYFLQSQFTDYDQLCRLDVLGLQDRSEDDQITVYDEFKEQLKKDEEGWYETGLMWKQSHPSLPNNKTASLARLTNLLRRLKRNPKLMKEYDQKIRDQLQEGIIEEAPEEPEGKEFYMPHKPVVREEAETTKMRIVYDASARANDHSPSLNECLEPGPPLQKKLWNILIRNRLRPVVLTGDIKQAFLQIRIKKECRDALRFHWIASIEDLQPIILRFTRAVFGLIQSPFLLGGTLECHLDKYKDEPYKTTAEMIKDDTYVDDFIGGGETVSKVADLKKKAIKIFGDASLQLHKWHSNVPELTTNLKENQHDESTNIEQNPATKDSAILGVPWNEKEDTFGVTIPKQNTLATKREVLRFMAAVYDPLGIISPIMLKGKLLYRDICDRKLSWDKPLPDDLWRRWLSWKQYLPLQVKVPRSIPSFSSKIFGIQLHAFADASKDGTSVALYAVVQQNNGTKQGLLGSKSRLAKRNLSIPRLELVAAHMAANMITNAREALGNFPINKIIAWSDSTVALHWIRGGGQYKQFVHNRVEKINKNRGIKWRYVSTDQNPADVGSRGCRGDKLKPVWFNGPAWLSEESRWPKDIMTTATEETEIETKKIKDLLTTVTEGEKFMQNLLDKFNLWKILRITAWIQRFCYNSKSKKVNRNKGPLTTKDMEGAMEYWIKSIQRNHENTDKFNEDKERLNLQKNKNGIYICMGRVNGDYPVYLPTKDLFSEKLVERAHLKTLHGGVGFTITEVRRNYWIPQLRRMAKGVIHRCHGCKRFHAIAFARPRQGNLPKDRTQGIRPFQVIGIDFAGPFNCIVENKTEVKAYILLYTCSLTRAVYIDLLPDQTLDGILDSIKTFIARRARPEKIYSDNFSSFVAAAKWFKKIIKEEKMHDFLAKQEIKWQFNLSRAPWWGGQFERLIGLMKQTLYRAMGRSKPKLKEFESLLLEVETVLNNRPLGYIEDDIQSSILTPNLMMFGVPVNITRQEDDDDDDYLDLKKRYKYLKNCRQKIWERWQNEYLRYLRERHNQMHHEKDIKLKVGDVVIIKGDERNRAHWKTGIVEKLIEGKDKIVRGARLRAGKDYLERAVQHLYPLELHCDRKRNHLDNSEHDQPREETQRSARNAAAIARILMEDQSVENNSVLQFE